MNTGGFSERNTCGGCGEGDDAAPRDVVEASAQPAARAASPTPAGKALHRRPQLAIQTLQRLKVGARIAREILDDNACQTNIEEP